jgi:hypothetical protein
VSIVRRRYKKIDELKSSLRGMDKEPDNKRLDLEHLSEFFVEEESSALVGYFDTLNHLRYLERVLKDAKEKGLDTEKPKKDLEEATEKMEKQKSLLEGVGYSFINDRPKSPFENSRIRTGMTADQVRQVSESQNIERQIMDIMSTAEPLKKVQQSLDSLVRLIKRFAAAEGQKEMADALRKFVEERHKSWGINNVPSVRDIVNGAFDEAMAEVSFDEPFPGMKTSLPEDVVAGWREMALSALES